MLGDGGMGSNGLWWVAMWWSARPWRYSWRFRAVPPVGLPVVWPWLCCSWSSCVFHSCWLYYSPSCWCLGVYIDLNACALHFWLFIQSLVAGCMLVCCCSLQGFNSSASRATIFGATSPSSFQQIPSTKQLRAESSGQRTPSVRLDLNCIQEVADFNRWKLQQLWDLFCLQSGILCLLVSVCRVVEFNPLNTTNWRKSSAMTLAVTHLPARVPQLLLRPQLHCPNRQQTWTSCSHLRTVLTTFGRFTKPGCTMQWTSCTVLCTIQYQPFSFAHGQTSSLRSWARAKSHEQASSSQKVHSCDAQQCVVLRSWGFICAHKWRQKQTDCATQNGSQTKSQNSPSHTTAWECGRNLLAFSAGKGR